MPVPLNERIFVALDTSTAIESLGLVSRLASTGVGFKIGPHNVLDDGWSNLVNGLCSIDNRRFIDLKHLDIPETVKRAVAKAGERQFHFATVHADLRTMYAALEAAKDSTLNILAVLHLTSAGSELPQSQIDDQIVFRLGQAIGSGCQGAICPPDKLRLVRPLVPDHFFLISPGIRLYGHGSDDHNHVGTPKQAIDDGADFLVIGRPIIEKMDPVGAVCQIIEQMR